MEPQPMQSKLGLIIDAVRVRNEKERSPLSCDIVHIPFWIRNQSTMPYRRHELNDCVIGPNSKPFILKFII